MVTIASSTMPLGAGLPDFSLPDVRSGEMVSHADFEGKKGLCVMFVCRHCPYVAHVREELAHIGRDYADRDVGIVAICANDANAYPDDAPDKLAEMAHALGFPFPLLYDETQETAKAFSAACTPEFFLFDAGRALVYRGQLDDSRPGNGVPIDGKDLRGAIDHLLCGETIDPEQTPSIGCNIKWKPGNEPDYFRAPPW